jgi:GNAT superfamily N-acetyltransferase
MNIDRRRLWKEAFGDSDAFLDLFSTTVYAPERSRTITVDGNLAAALYWLDCNYNGKKIAYIYAVATAKAYRGQGLCHRLMADTHGHLKEHGYAGAILVPGSKALFDLYAGMGYKVCAYINKMSCRAQGVVECREIDTDEYAMLRRQCLPQGGVVQEGANLDFLEKQARFFTGPGYLLAAQIDGDTLNGLELLGDSTAAPAIVATLDCRNGRFRMPGTEQPFAMYFPLRDEAAPSYFGFAFD